MKKYYAKQSVWGRDNFIIKEFTSLKARNEYVDNTDYSDKISAKEVKEYRKQRG